MSRRHVGGKARDAEAIYWEIHWDKVDDPAPGEDKIQWKLVSNLKQDCTSLSLQLRVMSLMETLAEPVDLREIGMRLDLPPDADGRVHAPLRKLASRCPALRRYRDDSVRPAMYFMPKEDRSPQNFPSISSSTGSKEPCSNTNGLDGSLLVPSDEHGTPVTFTGNKWNPTGNPETDCYDRAENTREPTGNPEKTDQHSEVPKPGPQFHRSEKNRAQPLSVFVDGSNGWSCPSGRLPKSGHVVLTDPHGQTHRIPRNRISDHPHTHSTN